MSPFTPDAAAALGGPEWLRDRRTAAAERFAATSLPTEAEEVWRYSRVSELDLDAFAPAGRVSGNGDDRAGNANGRTPTAIPARVVEALAAAGPRAGVLVLHNGRIVYRELDPALEARGVILADALDLGNADEAFEDADVDVDAFTELNAAFARGLATVRVPAGVEIADPLMIFHWFDGENTASFPRTVVAAGANSEAIVLEHQSSDDVVALVDPVVKLAVDDAARLRYVNVQALGPRVSQVGYQASSVDRDASLRSSVVALGGDYARVRADSRIEGKGGSAELNAVYFTDGDRMHDFRTLQDHIAPATSSDLLFKGAVQDRGRSVYSGLIRVQPEARGTNAFQTNRNLVLSEGAGAESVPNLEILTDDVRCSHASAVGPVDEDQLYYLESRGIPPLVAERLIVLGFLGEVLGRLPRLPLLDGLRADIGRRLDLRSETARAGAST